MYIISILYFSPIKPSQDLLNLDFFSTPSASNASGSRGNLPSPLSPMADTSLQNSTSLSAASTPLGNSSTYALSYPISHTLQLIQLIMPMIFCFPTFLTAIINID